VIGSDDGVMWSAPLKIHPNSPNHVLWNGSRWIAAGGEYARLVFTNDLYGVRFAGRILFALGKAGTVLREGCAAKISRVRWWR